MFKENGREKPAGSKATAELIGKTFKCYECGYIEIRRNVEFGKLIKCPKCNKANLAEDIEI